MPRRPIKIVSMKNLLKSVKLHVWKYNDKCSVACMENILKSVKLHV